MGSMIFVKVVGFSESERHALNTVFRLAQEQEPCYTLWLPDAPLPPHVALVDLDSHEADIALASPGHSPNLKMICVGERTHASAWRSFARPVRWNQVIDALNALFQVVDYDLSAPDDGGETLAYSPPGMKVALVMDESRDLQMYLRARLSLAGVVEVHDASTAAQGLDLVRKRYFDVVLCSADLPDIEPWKLIEQLVALEPAIGSVVMMGRSIDWQARERAEQLGCLGSLKKPFDPLEVYELLLKV